jgi:hypothetical protein
VLFSVACLYARAAAQARTGPRGASGPDDAAVYQDRALELLSQAIEKVPQAQRKAFWQANVENERELSPLRNVPKMQELARNYGG